MIDFETAASLKSSSLLDSSFLEKAGRLCREVPYASDVLRHIDTCYESLLSNTVHELQTVLSLMRSSLQYLEASHPEVRCYRHWTDLHTSCIFMTSLLRQLANLSTGSQLNLVRTDLQALLRNICLSCQALTEGTEKELSFISRASGLFLMLDREKLTEAVINLIVNALDSIAHEGQVVVSLSCEHSNAAVQITDNGCGIPPERLLSIFQPFVTDKPGGTGLGLPVAKRIIEGHGGYIYISSAPGSGTTFTFILPCNMA